MANDKQDKIIAALTTDMPSEMAALVRKIGKDQLLPASRKAYDTFVKRHGSDFDIYAVPADSGRPSLGQPIHGGRKVIVVGEEGVRWTEADVLRNRNSLAMLDNAREQVRDSELLAITAAMAASSGIAVPRLYAASDNDGRGAAGISREGVGYIIIDMQMNRSDILATVGHEVGHLAKGHNDPKQAAMRHNDPAISQAQEYEADEYPSKFGYKQEQIDFLAKNMCATNELKVSDLRHRETHGSHPSSAKRIHRLEQGADISPTKMLSCTIDTPRSRKKTKGEER